MSFFQQKKLIFFVLFWSYKFHKAINNTVKIAAINSIALDFNTMKDAQTGPQGRTSPNKVARFTKLAHQLSRNKTKPG